jgi:hypothetical protein
MDMTEFWDKFLRTSSGTAEEKMEQLRNLGLDNYIDPSQYEEFYNQFGSIMISFASHSRNKILQAYKQGQKIGGIRMLSPNQKKIMKQEKYSAYVSIEPTDGEWDSEGFEESFQGNAEEEDSVEKELLRLSKEDKEE